MRDYTVSMPIAGVVHLNVQANSEKEAIAAFHEKFHSLDKGLEDKECDYEWDFYEKMLSGNVRHFSYDQVEIEDNGEINE